jgi:hypothetical protein
MSTTYWSDRAAVVVAAVLVVLMALGNAWLMLAMSLVGAVVGLFAFPRSIGHSRGLAAILGAGLAAIIALALAMH